MSCHKIKPVTLQVSGNTLEKFKYLGLVVVFTCDQRRNNGD